jgi:hypothetical protein
MINKIIFIFLICFCFYSFAEDNRILLKLPYKNREDLLKGMRNNNFLMEQILLALSQNNFKKVEKIASSWLLNPKKSQNLPYRYDPNFIALAVDFHTNGAVDIIKAARTKNMSKTLESLSFALNRCNACHESYRVTEWPETKYPEPTAIPLKIPPKYNFSDWKTK